MDDPEMIQDGNTYRMSHFDMTRDSSYYRTLAADITPTGKPSLPDVPPFFSHSFFVSNIMLCHDGRY